MGSGRYFGNLRLAKSALFAEYLANTRHWMEVGNRVFAEFVADPRRPRLRGPRIHKPYVLYHAWEPDLYPIDARQATHLRRLMVGTRRPAPDDALVRDLDALGWLRRDPVAIDELVARAVDRFYAIQNRVELAAFLRFVQPRQLRTIVEIGTARGGMLYALAQLAHPRALVVSIDLPGGANCGGQLASERELFRTFARRHQRFEFVPANSQYHTTRERLRRILGRRAVDLLFIDGDHSYGGVRSDFAMYRELVRPRGLIALHDILMIPSKWGLGNEVGMYWRELKRQFPVTEFIDRAGVRARAKPRDRVWAWGIGVVEAPSRW